MTQIDHTVDQVQEKPQLTQVVEPAWGSGLTGSAPKPKLVQVEPQQPVNQAVLAEATQNDRDRVASLMQQQPKQEFVQTQNQAQVETVAALPKDQEPIIEAQVMAQTEIPTFVAATAPVEQQIQLVQIPQT